MLAVAIIATFIFVEFVALVALSFFNDGLEGLEIWLGINQVLLIVGGFAGAVVGIITLWVIAL